MPEHPGGRGGISTNPAQIALPPAGVSGNLRETHAKTTVAYCISSAVIKLPRPPSGCCVPRIKIPKDKSLVVQIARKAINAAKVWLARRRGLVTKRKTQPKSRNREKSCKATALPKSYGQSLLRGSLTNATENAIFLPLRHKTIAYFCDACYTH